MQAPKNGFFYVLDRETGELLSAREYVMVTWATHVDPVSGRPVEMPGARYSDSTVAIFPGPLGGHNWHPMAYSPDTGLVYIPAQEMSALYVPDKGFEYTKGQWNLGVRIATPEDVPAALLDPAAGITGELIADDPPTSLMSGHLLAWDPVRQQEVWRASYEVPWIGGVLTTRGNLVVHGSPFGMLTAYRADNGEKLWESYTGSGVIAAPITFEVGGTQYIAVMSGWGGAFGVVGTRSARLAAESEGRIVVYALGAEGDAIEREERSEVQVTRVEHESSEAQVKEGRLLFNKYCAVCHGYGAVGGGVITDVRQSSPRIYDFYDEIVLGGERVERGMPSFAPVLDEEGVALIRAFILHRRDMLAAEQAAAGR